MRVPTFPPPFLIDRIQQLGYATGPWRREDLVALWSEPMADKFIRDAKNAGWLVSPERGIYFVPSAMDLMTVNWLPPTIRSEVLVSRTLAAANLRYWCLSGMCREHGLDMGGPLFVTDLSSLDEQQEDLRSLGPSSASSRKRAASRQTVPWLDALIFIPALPQMVRPNVLEKYELPASPEVEGRRERMSHENTRANMVATFMVETAPEARNPADFPRIRRDARSIPYTTGPTTNDQAWVVALLASLGIARADELAVKLAKSAPELDRRDVQRHANMIGPPQPNKDWKKTMTEGPFPFLLVPPVLWGQMGADQASRRARALDHMVGGAIA